MADFLSSGDFGGYIRPEQAAGYFEQARRQSVVQQLARQVPLGASGVEVAVPQSKATASWVDEGGKKPTTKTEFGVKAMTPKKIAAIAVVSAEVVRANPANYVEIFRDDVAEAMATAFDAAVLHGTNSPFGDNTISTTTKAVTLGTADAAKGGVYADLTESLNLLVKDQKKLTGFAFDSQAEPILLSSVDTVGRPLFSEANYADSVLTQGRVIGRNAVIADGVASEDGKTLGYAGDWSQIVWGTVGGITFDVTTEAPVTLGGHLTSLWEHNLVGIRAEAEFGVIVNDADAFVKLNAGESDAGEGEAGADE